MSDIRYATWFFLRCDWSLSLSVRFKNRGGGGLSGVGHNKRLPDWIWSFNLDLYWFCYIRLFMIPNPVWELSNSIGKLVVYYDVLNTSLNSNNPIINSRIWSTLYAPPPCRKSVNIGPGYSEEQVRLAQGFGSNRAPGGVVANTWALLRQFPRI